MKFLVTIHHPEDYDPSVEDEAMTRDIDALNQEMVNAGVRVFVGGLYPPSEAKSIRAKADGDVSAEVGPYLRGAEHIGGLWVLEAGSMEEAVEWGRKGAVACRAPVEVRPFH